MVKIVFCTPIYKYIASPCFKSFMGLVTYLTQQQEFEADMIIRDGLYLPFNRSKMSKEALEKGADYVFWIDDDQVFNPTDVKLFIDRFLNNKQRFDIVGGLYNSRTLNKEVCAWKFKKDGSSQVLEANPHEGYRPCDMIGMGFCMMKAEVLKRMIEKHGVAFMTPQQKHAFVGDDHWFFMECKKEGFKTALDCDVPIGHFGGIL